MQKVLDFFWAFADIPGAPGPAVHLSTVSSIVEEANDQTPRPGTSLEPNTHVLISLSQPAGELL